MSYRRYNVELRSAVLLVAGRKTMGRGLSSSVSAASSRRRPRREPSPEAKSPMSGRYCVRRVVNAIFLRAPRPWPPGYTRQMNVFSLLLHLGSQRRACWAR